MGSRERAQSTSKPQQLLNHSLRGSGQSLLPLFLAIPPQQQGAERSGLVAVQALVTPGRWYGQDKPRRVLSSSISRVMKHHWLRAVVQPSALCWEEPYAEGIPTLQPDVEGL